MAGNVKVYGLFYSFPQETPELHGLYLTWEEAEAARKKQRPRKYWEVSELQIENSGSNRTSTDIEIEASKAVAALETFFDLREDNENI